VGVLSPDDMDLELDFEPEYDGLYDQIIKFIEKMPKTNVFYLKFLEEIQRAFPTGVIYR